MASVAVIFGGPRAGSDDSVSEPTGSVLDLRTTRLFSGWGGLLGLITGVFLGRSGGIAGAIAGGVLGMFLGSLCAILGLALFASMVARLGAIWAVAIGLALAALTTSLVFG